MKTILLIISIMIFGLYSCGDEVTNPTPTPEQETKKYTLEEILADSNWVEITDTIYIPTLHFLGYSSLHSSWEENNLKIINNESDYFKIKSISDTLNDDITKNIQQWAIDFNTRTLIGIKTIFSRKEFIFRKLFINNKINQIQYFILDKDTIRYTHGKKEYNLLIIPKIKDNYKIFGDYLYPTEIK